MSAKQRERTDYRTGQASSDATAFAQNVGAEGADAPADGLVGMAPLALHRPQDTAGASLTV